MKPTITVAVGGHSEHGKSTLVATLAGAARGAPVARAQLANARDTVVETDLAFVLLADAPAASWASLDASGRADVLLLVVDAARGPQAFTRDSVETARALGVPRVIAFVHDRDNPVDSELFDAAELLVREIVEAAGYDANDVPVIRGPLEDGGTALLRTLAETGARVVDRDAELAMPASFSFRTRPRAWVCTGRIAAGTLHKGDRVHVVGSRHDLRVDDVDATVARIELWHEEVPAAFAGDTIGVELTAVTARPRTPHPRFGVPPDAPPPTHHRRPVPHPSSPPAWRPDANAVFLVRAERAVASVFDAVVELHVPERGGRVRPLAAGAVPVIAFSRAFMDALVLSAEPSWAASMIAGTGGERAQFIAPGERGTIRIALRRSMPIVNGWRFAIRENGRTVGHGTIASAASSYTVDALFQLSRRARSRMGIARPQKQKVSHAAE